MLISVKNAHANNLKNISVNIPIGKITAITGVSGSGKSTLLKEILGAYGAQNYTRISSKTVKESLLIRDNTEVDKIENLPNTILIDVKSSISSPISTVLTVSGIHGILKNLFTEHGIICCKKCGNEVVRDYSLIKQLCVDLKIDDLFDQAMEFIGSKGCITAVQYFDKNGEFTSNEKKRSLATVYFSFNSVSEKIIREFNKQFSCTVCVLSTNLNIKYDFIKEIECPACHSVGPNLIRSRMSYNTDFKFGGGACRHCSGSGKVTAIKSDRVFSNPEKSILDGASGFITAKGIKYSTVTEKFIAALYDCLNLDIRIPICNLSNQEMYKIMHGTDKEITFMDRIGGKKTLIFQGIANYLEQSHKAHKGGNALNNLFDDSICYECEGSRFDQDINCFIFCGKSINSIMEMTLNDLGEWCQEIKGDAPERSHKYLDKIIKETDNFKLLSCSHLALYRSSNTLSGGELQRIRVCALLNADIHGLCYLLDEPSSGLHYSDIENLAVLLRRMCERGNTIIMVEHNKKLLCCCDHIIDMGPHGGRKGGNVLFSASLDDIKEYDTSTTRALLSTGQDAETFAMELSEKKDFLEFKNLTYNNLKNISARFPKDAYTSVCGISGSGKSTFIKHAVFEPISCNLVKYGFDGIDYIGQASKVMTSKSTVASLIKIGDYVSKAFEKASKLQINKASFVLGSSDGKCQCCDGKGALYSAADELIGVCDQCGGYGFTEEVLKIQIDGLNIYDFYNTNLEDLGGIVKDSKIKNLVDIVCKLGVGYLTFARQSKTLSKGELQRVSLIKVLIGKEKNHLLILDEPSKGLHASDVANLIDALRDVREAGNTILVVEHNPEMIKNADYIIEFGGTGANGGYVLFQGKPNEIKDTPTAKMLEGFTIGHSDGGNCTEREIVIEDNSSMVKYLPHRVYRETNHTEALIKAAKRTRKDFLSVAIPNNSIFSHLDRNIFESDTPIMILIDFVEKIKYNILVIDALGTRKFVDDEAANENETTIAKYIFDPTSPTGKCANCKGTGNTETVRENFFLKDGDLNAACKKFVKSSTDYALLTKALKKDQVDIMKNVRDMTEDEKMALFWGTDKAYEMEIKENGKTVHKIERWEGVMPYFVQYHNYYPDKSADAEFKNKIEIICPVCKGGRLKRRYSNYKCCGLSFSEWMSLTVDTLLERLSNIESNNIVEIQNRLICIKRLGLGNISLSAELMSLDAITAAKIKLASFYFNRIYGAGIVLKNMPNIDKREQDAIIKIIEDMKETNTIWIME